MPSPHSPTRPPLGRWAALAAQAAILALATGVAGCRAERPRLLGFSEEGAEAQAELERALLGEPSGDRMLEHHEALTSRPLHAGTQANREAAEYFAARLREYGFDSIAYYRYEVLLPRPRQREVRIVAPDTLELELMEPFLEALGGTEGSGETEGPEVLPPFNAYSGDGDVTAEIVYANYGLPSDFAVLDSLGVSVAGRIVLARYGEAWRGVKARLAAERGAVGVLLYSDPADDGPSRGAALPEGPWRPAQGVQSGSVLDLPRQPGDPLSPGWASVRGAERLPIEEATTILPIPVQPLSWGAARPILERLGGLRAPEAWSGGLDLDYHVGPGPVEVHLRLQADWSLHPVVNVIGLLPGAEDPDTWVMVGGHRDAWGFGGRDPMAGTASLLESARALASAARRMPLRRTIAVASWDAEEYGLIGSTEFGEQFEESLADRVVLYVNRESYMAGPFQASGSHALQPLVNDVARAVAAPEEEEATLYETWAGTAPDGAIVDHGGWRDVRLGALGSGSDYTVFLDHLGIPSLDVRFDRANGAYHSRYDTHAFFTRFGDPEFRTGEALAEFVALLVSRVANAEVLPFDHTATADAIEGYLGEIETEAEARGLSLDLRGVRRANDRLAFSAGAFNAATDRLLHLPPETRAQQTALLAEMNEVLAHLERDFLRAEGLPGRPWYRHQLYAPGYLTGYGASTLPGIREAVERGAVAEAREMATALEDALLRAVERLTEGLERAKALSGEDD